MTKYKQIDAVFHALANPTRRAVFERLCRGGGSASELAAPFDMALPSFMQHLEVLEKAGLVSSQKIGRVRRFEASNAPMLGMSSWLDEQRTKWGKRLDQLDDYLESTFEGAT
jgi:DNA-binding transcriptional ArsR family regulator